MLLWNWGIGGEFNLNNGDRKIGRERAGGEEKERERKLERRWIEKVSERKGEMCMSRTRATLHPSGLIKTIQRYL